MYILLFTKTFKCLSPHNFRTVRSNESAWKWAEACFKVFSFDTLFCVCKVLQYKLFSF